MNIRTSREPVRPGDAPPRSRVTVLVIVLGLLAAAAGVVVVVNLTRETGAVSSAPTPSVTPSPTLPLDPQASTKAAVTDAYTQSFKALIVVGGQSSASPNDPRLSEHTSGPALVAKQRAIAENKAKGLVIVGDAELHPTIIDLTSDSATVIECALDRTALVEFRTGTTVVDAGPNEGAASTSKLRLEGGVWKVTDFKDEKRSCVPPAA